MSHPLYNPYFSENQSSTQGQFELSSIRTERDPRRASRLEPGTCSQQVCLLRSQMSQSVSYRPEQSKTTMDDEIDESIDKRPTANDPTFYSSSVPSNYASGDDGRFHAPSKREHNMQGYQGFCDFDYRVVDKPAASTESSQPKHTKSAANILAHFGLEKEDLDHLIFYPEDQLNPANLTSILRQISIQKAKSATTAVEQMKKQQTQQTQKQPSLQTGQEIRPPVFPAAKSVPPDHLIPIITDVSQAMQRPVSIPGDPRPIALPPGLPQPITDHMTLPTSNRQPQAKVAVSKALPTSAMIHDYDVGLPKIFPHTCSLCNKECTHMKDWLTHQSSLLHLESCKLLRKQYPDWDGGIAPGPRYAGKDAKPSASTPAKSSQCRLKKTRHGSSSCSSCSSSPSPHRQHGSEVQREKRSSRSRSLHSSRYNRRSHSSSPERQLSSRSRDEKWSSPRRKSRERQSPSRRSRERQSPPRTSCERPLLARRSREGRLPPRRSRERQSPPRRSRERTLSPRRSRERQSPPRRSRERTLSPRRSRERQSPPWRSCERTLSPRRSRERQSPPKTSCERPLPARRSRERTLSPRRSRERQSPPRRSRERTLSPRRSRERQSPPRTSCERPLPARRSHKRRSPPRRSRERQSPPWRSRERTLSPRRSRERQSPPRTSCERPLPARRSHKRRSPPRRSRERQSPPWRSRERTLSPRRSRERQSPPRTSCERPLPARRSHKRQSPPRRSREKQLPAKRSRERHLPLKRSRESSSSTAESSLQRKKSSCAERLAKKLLQTSAVQSLSKQSDLEAVVNALVPALCDELAKRKSSSSSSCSPTAEPSKAKPSLEKSVPSSTTKTEICIEMADSSSVTQTVEKYNTFSPDSAQRRTVWSKVHSFETVRNLKHHLQDSSEISINFEPDTFIVEAKSPAVKCQNQPHPSFELLVTGSQAALQTSGPDGSTISEPITAGSSANPTNNGAKEDKGAKEEPGTEIGMDSTFCPKQMENKDAKGEEGSLTTSVSSADASFSSAVSSGNTVPAVASPARPSTLHMPEEAALQISGLDASPISESIIAGPSATAAGDAAMHEDSKRPGIEIVIDATVCPEENEHIKRQEGSLKTSVSSPDVSSTSAVSSGNTVPAFASPAHLSTMHMPEEAAVQISGPDGFAISEPIAAGPSGTATGDAAMKKDGEKLGTQIAMDTTVCPVANDDVKGQEGSLTTSVFNADAASTSAVSSGNTVPAASSPAHPLTLLMPEQAVLQTSGPDGSIISEPITAGLSATAAGDAAVEGDGEKPGTEIVMDSSVCPEANEDVKGKKGSLTTSVSSTDATSSFAVSSGNAVPVIYSPAHPYTSLIPEQAALQISGPDVSTISEPIAAGPSGMATGDAAMEKDNKKLGTEITMDSTVCPVANEDVKGKDGLLSASVFSADATSSSAVTSGNTVPAASSPALSAASLMLEHAALQTSGPDVSTISEPIAAGPSGAATGDAAMEEDVEKPGNEIHMDSAVCPRQLANEHMKGQEGSLTTSVFFADVTSTSAVSSGNTVPAFASPARPSTLHMPEEAALQISGLDASPISESIIAGPSATAAGDAAMHEDSKRPGIEIVIDATVCPEENEHVKRQEGSLKTSVCSGNTVPAFASPAHLSTIHMPEEAAVQISGPDGFAISEPIAAGPRGTATGDAAMEKDGEKLGTEITMDATVCPEENDDAKGEEGLLTTSVSSADVTSTSAVTSGNTVCATSSPTNHSTLLMPEPAVLQTSGPDGSIISEPITAGPSATAAGDAAEGDGEKPGTEIVMYSSVCPEANEDVKGKKGSLTTSVSSTDATSSFAVSSGNTVPVIYSPAHPYTSLIPEQAALQISGPDVSTISEPIAAGPSGMATGDAAMEKDGEKLGIVITMDATVCPEENDHAKGEEGLLTTSVSFADVTSTSAVSSGNTVPAVARPGHPSTMRMPEEAALQNSGPDGSTISEPITAGPSAMVAGNAAMDRDSEKPGTEIVMDATVWPEANEDVKGEEGSLTASVSSTDANSSFAVSSGNTVPATSSPTNHSTLLMPEEAALQTSGPDRSTISEPIAAGPRAIATGDPAMEKDGENLGIVITMDATFCPEENDHAKGEEGLLTTSVSSANVTSTSAVSDGKTVPAASSPAVSAASFMLEHATLQVSGLNASTISEPIAAGPSGTATGDAEMEEDCEKPGNEIHMDSAVCPRQLANEDMKGQEGSLTTSVSFADVTSTSAVSSGNTVPAVARPGHPSTMHMPEEAALQNIGPDGSTISEPITAGPSAMVAGNAAMDRDSEKPGTEIVMDATVCVEANEDVKGEEGSLTASVSSTDANSSFAVSSGNTVPATSSPTNHSTLLMPEEAALQTSDPDRSTISEPIAAGPRAIATGDPAMEKDGEKLGTEITMDATVCPEENEHVKGEEGLFTTSGLFAEADSSFADSGGNTVPATSSPALSVASLMLEHAALQTSDLSAIPELHAAGPSGTAASEAAMEEDSEKPGTGIFMDSTVSSDANKDVKGKEGSPTTLVSSPDVTSTCAVSSKNALPSASCPFPSVALHTPEEAILQNSGPDGSTISEPIAAGPSATAASHAAMEEDGDKLGTEIAIDATICPKANVNVKGQEGSTSVSSADVTSISAVSGGNTVTLTHPLSANVLVHEETFEDLPQINMVIFQAIKAAVHQHRLNRGSMSQREKGEGPDFTNDIVSSDTYLFDEQNFNMEDFVTVDEVGDDDKSPEHYTFSSSEQFCRAREKQSSGLLSTGKQTSTRSSKDSMSSGSSSSSSSKSTKGSNSSKSIFVLSKNSKDSSESTKSPNKPLSSDTVSKGPSSPLLTKKPSSTGLKRQQSRTKSTVREKTKDTESTMAKSDLRVSAEGFFAKSGQSYRECDKDNLKGPASEDTGQEAFEILDSIDDLTATEDDKLEAPSEQIFKEDIRPIEEDTYWVIDSVGDQPMTRKTESKIDNKDKSTEKEEAAARKINRPSKRSGPETSAFKSEENPYKHDRTARKYETQTKMDTIAGVSKKDKEVTEEVVYEVVDSVEDEPIEDATATERSHRRRSARGKKEDKIIFNFTEAFEKPEEDTYKILDSVEDETTDDKTAITTRSTRGKKERTTKKDASNEKIKKGDTPTRRRHTPARESQERNREKTPKRESKVPPVESTPTKKKDIVARELSEDATCEISCMEEEVVKHDWPATAGKGKRGRPKKQVKTTKKDKVTLKDDEDASEKVAEEEEAVYQIVDSVEDETVDDQPPTGQSESAREENTSKNSDKQNIKNSSLAGSPKNEEEEEEEPMYQIIDSLEDEVQEELTATGGSDRGKENSAIKDETPTKEEASAEKEGTPTCGTTVVEASEKCLYEIVDDLEELNDVPSAAEGSATRNEESTLKTDIKKEDKSTTKSQSDTATRQEEQKPPEKNDTTAETSTLGNLDEVSEEEEDYPDDTAEEEELRKRQASTKERQFAKEREARRREERRTREREERERRSRSNSSSRGGCGSQGGTRRTKQRGRETKEKVDAQKLVTLDEVGADETGEQRVPESREWDREITEGEQQALITLDEFVEEEEEEEGKVEQSMLETRPLSQEDESVDSFFLPLEITTLATLDEAGGDEEEKPDEQQAEKTSRSVKRKHDDDTGESMNFVTVEEVVELDEEEEKKAVTPRTRGRTKKRSRQTPVRKSTRGKKVCKREGKQTSEADVLPPTSLNASSSLDKDLSTLSSDGQPEIQKTEAEVEAAGRADVDAASAGQEPQPENPKNLEGCVEAGEEEKEGRSRVDIKAVSKQRRELIEPEAKRSRSQSPCVSADFKLPAFKPNNPLGQNFVVPKSVFFCNLCSVFYLNESTTKDLHCSSQRHYDNLQKHYQKLQQSRSSTQSSQGSASE
ncbi:mucin-17-like isoform X2 [Micropterus salmoides]|uniref:mucin-17-like isoform X2 n=1 Tax=Micropterus salmoides TaxID=27706 RepID=UPI0018ECCB60|nr:mucin-17-like isoform X2 [Micropterus salmoides]